MSEWQLWSATLFLLALAVWLLMRSAHAHSEQAIGDAGRPLRRRRRRALSPRESGVEWVYEHLTAAGVSTTPRSIALWGGGLLLLAMFALILAGSRWGPLLVVAVLAALEAVLRVRASRLRERARSQLAPFMEYVMRDLGAGQSLELAFRQGVRRVPAPLGEALQRILLRRELGMELHEGLAREARVLGLFELELLATAVEISQVHGGSLREMLASFVRLLHLQERGRRELSAMTGETRVTAFILLALPILLAAYMFGFNREFVQPMLDSGGGRIALGVAVGLQLAGTFALWRMLRAV